MRRFAIFFGALVLTSQITGCGGGSGASTTTASRADDPRLPAEVREYEARNAKRLAERAATKAPGKPARSARGIR
jgi:hypothetical protein